MHPISDQSIVFRCRKEHEQTHVDPSQKTFVRGQFLAERSVIKNLHRSITHKQALTTRQGRRARFVNWDAHANQTNRYHTLCPLFHSLRPLLSLARKLAASLFFAFRLSLPFPSPLPFSCLQRTSFSGTGSFTEVSFPSLSDLCLVLVCNRRWRPAENS